MILRNNQYPKGKDMGPAVLFSVSQLNLIGGGLGMGAEQGQSWNGTTRTIDRTPKTTATSRKIVYPLIDPAGHSFKATDPRAKWCSHQCQARNWYRMHRLKGQKPARMADCHPKKPHYAKGLCIPCYSASRRQAVAQGN